MIKHQLGDAQSLRKILSKETNPVLINIYKKKLDLYESQSNQAADYSEQIQSYHECVNSGSLGLSGRFYYANNKTGHIFIKQNIDLISSDNTADWIAFDMPNGDVLIFPNVKSMNAFNYDKFVIYEFNIEALSGDNNRIEIIKPCIAVKGKLIHSLGKMRLY